MNRHYRGPHCSCCMGRQAGIGGVGAKNRASRTLNRCRPTIAVSWHIGRPTASLKLMNSTNFPSLCLSLVIPPAEVKENTGRKKITLPRASQRLAFGWEHLRGRGLSRYEGVSGNRCRLNRDVLNKDGCIMQVRSGISLKLEVALAEGKSGVYGIHVSDIVWG